MLRRRVVEIGYDDPVGQQLGTTPYTPREGLTRPAADVGVARRTRRWGIEPVEDRRLRRGATETVDHLVEDDPAVTHLDVSSLEEMPPVVPGPRVGIETVEGTDHLVDEGFRFDPAGVAAFASGFLLSVYGLLALVRAGFDGFPTEQVTVAGLTVSSLVSLITLIVGIGLLTSSVSGDPARNGLVFFSAIMIVVGIVVIGDSTSLPLALRASPGLGWLVTFLGIGILVAALLPARTTARWSASRWIRL